MPYGQIFTSFVLFQPIYDQDSGPLLSHITDCHAPAIVQLHATNPLHPFREKVHATQCVRTALLLFASLQLHSCISRAAASHFIMRAAAPFTASNLHQSLRLAVIQLRLWSSMSDDNASINALLLAAIVLTIHLGEHFGTRQAL